MTTELEARDFDGTDPHGPWTAGRGEEIAYGTLGNDTAVFIPKRYAEPLRELRHALGASTWGELRARLSADTVSRIAEQHSDWDEEGEAPPDGAAFSADEVYGYGDGDWPAWPAQRMLDWVPTDIVRNYGRETSSVLNGEFLEVAAEQAEPMADALRAQGFICERDDYLVAAASGWA